MQTDDDAGDRAVQGRVVGVIRPPPDIRAVLEKTASFIAKNGAEFEARILEQQAGVAKFGFLRPDNPYHAYYKQRIATEKEEMEKAAKAKAMGLPAPAAEAAPAPAEAAAAAAQPAEATPAASADASAVVRKVAAVTNPVTKALRMLQLAKDVTESGTAASVPPGEDSLLPSPPAPSQAYLASLLAPKDLYTVSIPTFASAEDIETVRTTAQFVAAGGRSFLNALTEREEANPSFGFLRRTHALFPFFTAMVEAYARVIHLPAIVKEGMTRDASPIHGRASVLERVVARLEAKRKVDEAKAAAGDAGAAAAVAPIDWHDFVVVETITLDFAAVDVDGSEGGEAAGGRSGAGLEGGGDDAAASHRGGSEPSLRVASTMPLGTAPASLVQSVSASALAGAAAAAVFVDPSTGRLIRAEEAALHIKAETMDPQWRKDRDTFLSRQSVTSFVAGDEVAANLQRMAAKRGDVFGGRGNAAAGAPEAKRPRLG